MWEAATTQLREVLRVDPELWSAYFRLGEVCAKQGLRTEAVDALGKYLKNAPAGPHAAAARRLLEELSP